MQLAVLPSGPVLVGRFRPIPSRVATCGGLARVSPLHVVPPRRANEPYMPFEWGADSRDDLDDVKDVYNTYLRSGDQPFTSTNRARRSPMQWRNDAYYPFDDEYDEFEDEHMDEYSPQQPVKLNEEKRFLNGKQILTNYDITAPLLRLIGQEKEQIGMKTRDVALQMALDAGVDLLLINPQEAPPVARLMQWSKYKFEIEVGEWKQKKKTVVVETKEVRISPKTDDHDIQTKTKSTQKFLDKGNKVKLVMKFEGRQLQHKDHGKEVLMKFISDLGDYAKVEGPLSFKGAMYSVTLVPGKTAGSPQASSASSSKSAPQSPQQQSAAATNGASAAPAAPASTSSPSTPAAAPAGRNVPVQPPLTRPTTGTPPPQARPTTSMPPGGIPGGAGGPIRPGSPRPMALPPTRPPTLPVLQPLNQPSNNLQPVSSRQY